MIFYGLRKTIAMGQIYNAVAILSILIWVIAFFAYNFGQFIHVMPVMAVVLFVLSYREQNKKVE